MLSISMYRVPTVSEPLCGDGPCAVTDLSSMRVMDTAPMITHSFLIISSSTLQRVRPGSCKAQFSSCRTLSAAERATLDLPHPSTGKKGTAFPSLPRTRGKGKTNKQTNKHRTNTGHSQVE